MKQNTLWWAVFPFAMSIVWLPVILGLNPNSYNYITCLLLGISLLSFIIGTSAGQYLDYEKEDD